MTNTPSAIDRIHVKLCFDIEADVEAIAVVEVEWVGVVAAAGVGRKESEAGLELNPQFQIACVPIQPQPNEKLMSWAFSDWMLPSSLSLRSEAKSNL